MCTAGHRGMTLQWVRQVGSARARARTRAVQDRQVDGRDAHGDVCVPRLPPYECACRLFEGGCGCCAIIQTVRSPLTLACCMSGCCRCATNIAKGCCSRVATPAQLSCIYYYYYHYRDLQSVWWSIV